MDKKSLTQISALVEVLGFLRLGADKQDVSNFGSFASDKTMTRVVEVLHKVG